MYETNLAKRLPQVCVHLMTARASLLTDHRMSGLPFRAKYKHVKTICHHTFDNYPTDSSSSCLNRWSSKQGLETFFICSTFLFANSHYRTMQPLLRDVSSNPGSFSVAVAEIRDSNISLYSFLLIAFGLHSRWVHPKYTWSRNDVASPRSTSFIKFFHIGAIFCFFPVILMSST